MKQLLSAAICIAITLTSCSDNKNLAEPKSESDTEELVTTREFEVDGVTYIDYINSKGEIKLTMGGDLRGHLHDKK